MISELFEVLNGLRIVSTEITEDFGFLTFRGQCKSVEDFHILLELEDRIGEPHILQSLALTVDKEPFRSVDDFLENLYTNANWTITFNKLNYIGTIGYTFFYNSESFKEWSSRIKAFDPNSIFNNNGKFKIIVNDISNPFGGPNFIVCCQNDNLEFEELSAKLPIQDQIKKVVHSITKEEICINPVNHLLTFGEWNEYSSSFFERAAASLVVCLCNEVTTGESIIIRGVRRLDMSISPQNKFEISKSYINSLVDAVCWVYEERTDLRLKLLLDRITLDINYQEPYVEGLNTVIANSLQQAKERYSFIIFDRKDEYQKELRELLKDLKNLSELYASKVRSVLNNLLRDILASIVLVGFTVFTKTTDIAALKDNGLIKPLFIIFALYFMVSIAIQSIADWLDIGKARKEFIYWRNISREYISKSDFEKHMKETINKRKNISVVLYSIVASIYVLLSIACFYFDSLYSYLMSI